MPEPSAGWHRHLPIGNDPDSVQGRRRLLVVRDLPPPAHKAACCLAQRDALGRLPIGYCSPTCERRR